MASISDRIAALEAALDALPAGVTSASDGNGGSISYDRAAILSEIANLKNQQSAAARSGLVMTRASCKGDA